MGKDVDVAGEDGQLGSKLLFKGGCGHSGQSDGHGRLTAPPQSQGKSGAFRHGPPQRTLPAGRPGGHRIGKR